MSGASNREEADDYRAIVVRLNTDWRVIVCRAGIQWIIQRRGAKRAGADRWNSVAFHRFRDGMIGAIKERCGTVTPEALAAIGALPARIDEQPMVTA